MKRSNRVAQSLSQLALLMGALLMALLVGAILIGIAGANPLVAYRAMFLGPFSGRFGMTESLVKATPLLLVGLGVITSFRSGILNIGGEGQMVMGAIAGAAVALALPKWPAVILLPLALIASVLAALFGADCRMAESKAQCE